MYSGPARPASQVARLQPGGHLFRAVSIRSVDDKSLGMGNRYAEVLPGRHTVLVELTTGNGNVTRRIQREVTFVAKPGQTYTVEAKETGFWSTRFWVWIEDATGTVIAGQKPK
jgi:hypothetical protein